MQQARAQLATGSKAEAAKIERASGEHAEWESRAVAQLEADIEAYRGRIKTTLQERDELARERDLLAAQFTSEREGLAGRVRDLEAKLGQMNAEFERAQSGAATRAASLQANTDEQARSLETALRERAAFAAQVETLTDRLAAANSEQKRSAEEVHAIS